MFWYYIKFDLKTLLTTYRDVFSAPEGKADLRLKKYP